jgi:putative acetyltransferase
MLFREATSEDRSVLLQVQRLAFGQGEEADLVESLLSDPTAKPLLSLVAEKDGIVIGHVLFTRLSLLGPDKPPPRLYPGTSRCRPSRPEIGRRARSYQERL